MTLPHRPTTPCLLLIVALLVNACGGSGGGSGGSSSPAGGTGGGPTTPPPINLTRVSAASPYTANCQGNDTSGTLYTQAEVEPYAAINPIDPNNIIAVWQQDRWSNGASRGTVTGVSFDRGVTWAPRVIPYSRCGGGEYERASDPWVTFSPNGVAYQMALAVTGTSFTATSINAMLVSRSTDG
ncbi:MAG: hypothetical protein JNM52_03370, partial [Betaproteobacteria bacterium]|nr:hypothetical protein [Betaproteobacteria bacterium]